MTTHNDKGLPVEAVYIDVNIEITGYGTEVDESTDPSNYFLLSETGEPLIAEISTDINQINLVSEQYTKPRIAQNTSRDILKPKRHNFSR